MLHRMNFVQRKATTSKSKYTEGDFVALKEAFLDDKSEVLMEDIPPELVLNCDQTGIIKFPQTLLMYSNQWIYQLTNLPNTF